MKLLTKYIIRETTLYFIICLFAFTGILLTIRLLKFASLIINKGVGLGDIAMVFIAIIPTFLEIAIPMATLLGVMLAFARLSGDSEIIVIRASGVSLNQLLKPIILFCLLAASLSLYVSTSLKPWGYKTLSATLFKIASSTSIAGLNEGIFNDLGNLMLYTKKIDYSTGNMSDILIDDRRDQENRKIVVATLGKIASHPENQTINIRLFDGDIHELLGDKYVVTNFNSNDLTFEPEELQNATMSGDGHYRDMMIYEIEEKMSIYKELINNPESVKSNTRESYSEISKKYNRMKIEINSRFSMPFASLILALIAMPLGIQPPRTQKTWGAGLSTTIGMIVFIIYYGLLSVGVAMAESSSLNSNFALWLPNMLALLVAIFMLKQMSTEKWQSISHGVEEMAEYCSKKLKLS